MLTRRKLLAGGAAAALLSESARADGAHTLTAADVHVDGYPTVEAVRWIGRELERETGGRLRIRVYHSGQLGREGDVVNLARFGALDIARVNVAVLNNAFPLTSVLALPYVFDSTAHMRRALDGAVGRRILEGFKARGLVGLAYYDSGVRCFYNHRHPVHAPRDLAGLKIRVPPSDIFIASVRALGANPTPLSYGEVYSALQTRLIDGAENNWPTYYSSRQFEVARHWSESGHSYAPEVLLMSRDRFEALAPGDRERLLGLAERSVSYMRELWDRREQESREAVLRAGVTVTEVDRAAFRKAVAPLLEKQLREPVQSDLYAQIREVS